MTAKAAQDWDRQLDRVLVVTRPRYRELETLSDARDYILKMGRRSERQEWQTAIKRLLEAADGGSVELATRQMVVALMMDGTLGIGE